MTESAAARRARVMRGRVRRRAARARCRRQVRRQRRRRTRARRTSRSGAQGLIPHIGYTTVDVDPFYVGKTCIQPIPMRHGSIRATGYRIGSFAYLTDTSGVPASSRALLQDLDAVVVDALRYEATRLFDAQQPCGAEANLAKLLAADASWQAANVCLQTHGGYGFAAEYDVERKFRETRLYQVAPISTNLILSYLGEHVLGMPRSF